MITVMRIFVAIFIIAAAACFVSGNESTAALMMLVAIAQILQIIEIRLEAKQ